MPTHGSSDSQPPYTGAFGARPGIHAEVVQQPIGLERQQIARVALLRVAKWAVEQPDVAQVERREPAAAGERTGAAPAVPGSAKATAPSPRSASASRRESGLSESIASSGSAVNRGAARSRRGVRVHTHHHAGEVGARAARALRAQHLAVGVLEHGRPPVALRGEREVVASRPSAAI